MGHKSTKVQAEAILQDVMRLQIECACRWEIIQYCAATYKLGVRATDKYIARANEQFVIEAEKDRSKIFHKQVRRLERMIQAAQTKGDLRAAASLMKELDDISGLRKQIVELSGPGGGAIPSQVEASVDLDSVLKEALGVTTQKRQSDAA